MAPEIRRSAPGNGDGQAGGVPAGAAACVCEIHAESVFRVEGMDCHEEVAILERRLKPLTGVEALSADVMAQRLRVTYDAAKLSTSTITDAVADTGMRAWLEHEDAARVASLAGRSRWWLVAVSGASTAAGLAFHAAGADGLAATILNAAAIATGGLYWVRRAWSAARVYSPDINVLMLLAVVGAMAIGQWSEAATVTFLFALAQLLESRVDGTRAARDPCADGTDAGRGARAARRRRDAGSGSTRSAWATRSSCGRARRSRSTAGCSKEPARSTRRRSPASRCRSTKVPGDEVFAGTINGHGALTFEVTHLRRDTTLARIIGLVEHAQAQRAPSQTLRGALRADLHARGDRARRRGGRRATARARAALRDLVLPGARAARHLVPVRARDLDARLHRVGPGVGREEGRAHQGRAAPRADGGRAVRGLRQDGHADPGRAGGGGSRADGRLVAPGRPSDCRRARGAIRPPRRPRRAAPGRARGRPGAPRRRPPVPARARGRRPSSTEQPRSSATTGCSSRGPCARPRSTPSCSGRPTPGGRPCSSHAPTRRSASLPSRTACGNPAGRPSSCCAAWGWNTS